MQRLVARLGVDSIRQFERAATRRYAEAERLVQHEPLGAIYLWGYTIEMRLKAAYGRLMRWLPTDDFGPLRNIAQGIMRQQFGTVGPAGHNLTAWAKLLIHTRATSTTVAPFGNELTKALNNHVVAASLIWAVELRYHANKPRSSEVSEMQAAARWFRRHASRLWR